MAIKDYTIEELISRLCYLWSKETKTALEYCNPDTLSMAFEGELHSIFNYSWNIPYCERAIEKFEKLFAKYGLYYELGNSWNLSLYEN